MGATGAEEWDDDDWVEGTDLALYLRCPHAWWSLDRGRISSGDEGVAELLAGVAPARTGPALENAEMGIRGVPAGVEPDGGAMWPIEARSREHMRRDDRLALAFDWLLLEPRRARRVASPMGLLILRRDGEPVEIEVDLDEADFRHVGTLLERMREARRSGLRRRPCACPVCGAARRRDRRSPALTSLFELGKARAAALAEVGIGDCRALELGEPEAVAEALQARGTSIPAAQIEQMRLHARSYREQRPVLFGPPPDPGDSFIALDLEYDTFQPRLWLIGLYVVGRSRARHIALWADDDEGERRNLERLAAVLEARRGGPVLTWAGTSADLPQLLGACRRLGLDGLLDELEERHIDLFAEVRHCLRLPIPDLSLGGVASFFAVAKASDIANGREAQSLYSRYRRQHGLRVRERIRQELIDYNRDDLELLVECLREIQALSPTPVAV